MNERIGKFKKISVASARQRRVQGSARCLCFLYTPLVPLSPLFPPHSVRSSPVSRGTCTCAAPIAAQIHLRYSRPSPASFLPLRIYMCTRVNPETRRSTIIRHDDNNRFNVYIVYCCSVKSEYPAKSLVTTSN